MVVLYKTAWKVVYRSKQLPLTNFLEAVLVGTLLGTIYIHAGYGEAGAHKRLGLFAFTLTFLLTSTTETLPTFVTERPIVLAETAAGLYRLSSHVAAATLVFLPYLLAVALLYSVCVYFLVGLCSSAGAFAAFVLVVWAVVFMHYVSPYKYALDVRLARSPSRDGMVPASRLSDRSRACSVRRRDHRGGMAPARRFLNRKSFSSRAQVPP